MCGDPDFEEVSRIAGATTFVPGVIRPLTAAMLLSNTVLVARLRGGGG
jgi:methylenetetrahydrofolate dehydrogenase (NADP+)/methenyltetrahydrofolate cyclohydrolase